MFWDTATEGFAYRFNHALQSRILAGKTTPYEEIVRIAAKIHQRQAIAARWVWGF